jgi:hypothetical protein
MTRDTEGDAAIARFVALLDEAATEGRTLQFWWRDDDAEDVTPALERLLSLASRFDLPLALAIVPKGATGTLAARLKQETRVAVLQHGWAHANHAAESEKKIELGGTQPLSETLDELRRGRALLQSLMGEKLLPTLVPPWNRIANDVRERLPDLGFTGLSTAGPADTEHQVNTHLDIFAWRPARRPLTRAEAYSRLSAEVERRIAGSDEPIGILTHHLVHEDASWALLEEIFAATARHSAVRRPDIAELWKG